MHGHTKCLEASMHRRSYIAAVGSTGGGNMDATERSLKSPLHRNTTAMGFLFSETALANLINAILLYGCGSWRYMIVHHIHSVHHHIV